MALAGDIAAAADVDEMLDGAVDALAELLDAAACGVALPDDQGVLRFRAYHGPREDSMRRAELRPGEGPVGRAFLERQAQQMDDPWADVGPGASDPRLAGRALLAVPLLAHGRVMGVIAVVYRAPGGIAAQHQALVQVVGAHLATAIERTAAHERARHESAEKSALLARQHTLYDTLACGVVVQDAAGAVLYANPAAEALLGLPLEQMRRRETSPWPLLGEDGARLTDAEYPVWRAARGGLPLRGVTVGVVHPSGERRWLQLDAVPIAGEDGAVFQVVTSFVDVTARRLQEMGCRDRLRLPGLLDSALLPVEAIGPADGPRCCVHDETLSVRPVGGATR